jgi:hypothetical protein
MTLVVRNAGTAALTVSSLAISGAGFSIVSSTPIAIASKCAMASQGMAPAQEHQPRFHVRDAQAIQDRGKNLDAMLDGQCQ